MTENNNKKIDYEYLIHSHSCVGKEKECDMRLSCNECIKRDFEAVGLGNVEQAVKEFASQVLKRADDKAIFQEWYNYEKLGGRLIGIDELKHVVDNLITELYGDNTEDKHDHEH